MTQTQPSKRIHPLVATAAVSVILVSMVGVAAMTGILPNSNSTPKPGMPLAASAMDAGGQTNALMDNGRPASSMADNTKQSNAQKLAADKDDAPVQHHPKVVHKTPSYASQQNNYDNNPPVRVAQARQICDSCGVVESVHANEQQAQQGSGLGAVAGALLGGVLGNQVGGGNGRKLATVAGAVGGGYAGNSIEKRTNTSTVYEVRVRMENGNTRTFTPSSQPGWRAGDHVKVIDGHLVSD
ncbi:glycine zipper 2TM domain-containing protein [soil metagenome]